MQTGLYHPGDLSRLSRYKINRRVIMPAMLPELQLEDIVRLRKAHPCGGYEWKIVRLGADIGLECLTCGRRVLLPRRQLARRIKTILNRTQDDTSKN